MSTLSLAEARHAVHLPTVGDLPIAWCDNASATQNLHAVLLLQRNSAVFHGVQRRQENAVNGGTCDPACIFGQSILSWEGVARIVGQDVEDIRPPWVYLRVETCSRVYLDEWLRRCGIGDGRRMKVETYPR